MKALINKDVVDYWQPAKGQFSVVSILPQGSSVPKERLPYHSGHSIAKREPKKLQMVLKALKAGKFVSLPLLSEEQEQRIERRVRGRMREIAFSNALDAALGKVPAAAPTTQPASAPAAKKPTAPAKPASEWDAVGMCALLRWCGKQGWGLTDAEKVVRACGFDPRPNTLRHNVRDGQKNLKVPALSKEQIGKLEEMRGPDVQMTLEDVLPKKKSTPRSASVAIVKALKKSGVAEEAAAKSKALVQKLKEKPATKKVSKK